MCGGFGHSHKICPTNRKFKHFSKAGISQTIIKRAKTKAKEKHSRANQGLTAPWSCVPNALGPRPRATY